VDLALANRSAKDEGMLAASGVTHLALVVQFAEEPVDGPEDDPGRFEPAVWPEANGRSDEHVLAKEGENGVEVASFHCGPEWVNGRSLRSRYRHGCLPWAIDLNSDKF
jgi:hypothetical protein